MNQEITNLFSPQMPTQVFDQILHLHCKSRENTFLVLWRNKEAGNYQLPYV